MNSELIKNLDIICDLAEIENENQPKVAPIRKWQRQIVQALNNLEVTE